MNEAIVFQVPDHADIKIARKLREDMLTAFEEARKSERSLLVKLEHVVSFDSSFGQILIALLREGIEKKVKVDVKCTEVIPSVASIFGCEHDCRDCLGSPTLGGRISDDR